jgi:SAM-dependent methyltransferase
MTRAQTTPKQALLWLVRKLGLLPILERVHFWRELVRRRKDNAVFTKEISAPLPPLWWVHDMYGHCLYRRYWNTGKASAQKIDQILQSSGMPPDAHIAEWGCGMGRILRHMPESYERYGFDYNSEAIKWCSEHLSGHWRGNGLMPPLPMEDESLDAVFAISVFTHLSREAHFAWVREIFRVLKPGGIFVPSFHGTPKAGQLLPHEQTRFDRGELVVRGDVKEGSRIYTSYHPRHFVENELLIDFIIEQPQKPAFGQALYIMRKPETRT